MSNFKLLFISALFFASFNAYSQKDKGFNFPPEFGKMETLVVINFHGEKVTKAIVEAFEKEYGGKFQQIEERTSGKYKPDSAITVYMLSVIEKPSASMDNSSDYKFGLTNLKTRKAYWCDFWSGSYKKGAKYYVKHLERWRKENGGR